VDGGGEFAFSRVGERELGVGGYRRRKSLKPCKVSTLRSVAPPVLPSQALLLPLIDSGLVVTTSGEVSQGEKMSLRDTDPESFITGYSTGR